MVKKIWTRPYMCPKLWNYGVSLLGSISKVKFKMMELWGFLLEIDFQDYAKKVGLVIIIIIVNWLVQVWAWTFSQIKLKQNMDPNWASTFKPI